MSDVWPDVEAALRKHGWRNDGTAPVPTPVPPTPIPVPPVSPVLKLAFQPPDLVLPQTFEITNKNPTANIPAGKDAKIIVKEPITVIGGIKVVGGRNWHLLGGEVAKTQWFETGTNPGKSRETNNRGLYANGWTGTAHVEGLYAHDHVSDFINIDNRNPNTTFQWQMCRATGLSGWGDGNHADGFQTWAGSTIVRCNMVTIESDYQGFLLQSGNRGPLVKTYDFRHVNITGLEPLPGRAALGRHLIAQSGGDAGRDPAPKCTDVWLDPSSKYDKESGYSISWVMQPIGSLPGLNHGPRPGGDFVHAGDVGMEYKPPTSYGA